MDSVVGIVVHQPSEETTHTRALRVVLKAFVFLNLHMRSEKVDTDGKKSVKKGGRDFDCRAMLSLQRVMAADICEASVGIIKTVF